MIYYILGCLVFTLVGLRVDHRNFKRNMEAMRLKADIKAAMDRMARK